MNTRINRDIFTETGCIQRDLLLRYRDGKLSSNEKYEVEKHLVDCPLCSDALEGLGMVASTVAFDEIRNEISELVNRKQGTSFQKYWVAAASIAAIIVLSVFTYMQFRDSNTKRMAANENLQEQQSTPPLQESEQKPATDSVHPDKAVEVPVPVEILSPKRMAHAGTASATISSGATASEKFNTQNEGVLADEVSSSVAADAEQAAAPVAQSAGAVSSERTASKDLHHINASSNFITYVDNLKVIDYKDVDTKKEQSVNTENPVPVQYQNKEKKQTVSTEVGKSGDASLRKTTYTGIISKPVILYNQGRYESAVKGFDEVLAIHPDDQNAIFYKGMSLYHLSKFNQSVLLLLKISKTEGSPFAEEATFYVAMSHLGCGEKEKARVLLQDIVKENGFYAEQAADELRKLSDNK